uniref:Uncharacterized protein LOC111127188 isoform X1 n=1 Tax=Crassostrea virginica TaxID=6565 RepID=A0A8B8DJF9_CRAVI|nr:uncharacterized protein LOC111127188 isoform X1 [Crassostrea virginica]
MSRLIYMYVSIHVLFLTNLTTSRYCGTEGFGDICCDNYYFDSNSDDCMECPKGSYGQNCIKTCVYPKYGWLCYQTCECADFEYCNLVDGCLNVSTISTSTFEQSEGTTVMEPGTLSTIISSASESTQTGNESTKKKSTSRERSGIHLPRLSDSLSPAVLYVHPRTSHVHTKVLVSFLMLLCLSKTQTPTSEVSTFIYFIIITEI